MRIGTYQHIEEEVLEKYSMGAIPEADATRLEEHLLICEFCQGRLTETDRYVSTMQLASAQIRRQSTGSKNRWWSFPAQVPTFAAAALILFLAVTGLRLGNRGDVSQSFRVDLIASRGNGIEAKAPADTALALQLELAGLESAPFFRMEIVDRVGKRVWQGDVIARDSRAVAAVPKMSSGIYFVRAYTPSGELLREYGLEIVTR